MTREERENAIEFFKFHRKMFCEDYLKKIPKDSIGYQATLKEISYYNMAVKALEQEPCEDAVSRQYIIEKLNEIDGTAELDKSFEIVENAPQVIPKGVTVTEFADRCRECGKMKKGKWIFSKTIFDKYGYTVECSSCHKKWKTYDEIRWEKENKYCPNCGTEMESENV